MMSSVTPVIIGVGDVVNRSLKVEDAKEPATLIFEAIQNALKDSSTDAQQKLKSSIDSLSIVSSWTWPYPDLTGLLASKLGVQPSHKEYTEHGGNQPGRAFDEAARRVAQGKSKVAVIAGGEALASRISTISL